jgi:hypothetical protein
MKSSFELKIRPSTVGGNGAALLYWWGRKHNRRGGRLWDGAFPSIHQGRKGEAATGAETKRRTAEEEGKRQPTSAGWRFLSGEEFGGALKTVHGLCD